MAKDLHLSDVTSLYAALGEGRVSPQNVVERVLAFLGGEEGATEDLAEAVRPELTGTDGASGRPSGFRVGRHGTTSLRVGAASIWLSVIVLLPLSLFLTSVGAVSEARGYSGFGVSGLEAGRPKDRKESFRAKRMIASSISRAAASAFSALRSAHSSAHSSSSSARRAS